MSEAVEHRGGDDRVAEDLAAGGEGLVGGHDQRAALVAGVDELEEQAGGVGVEGEVADLVDDQQRVAVEQARLARLERR